MANKRPIIQSPRVRKTAPVIQEGLNSSASELNSTPNPSSKRVRLPRIFSKHGVLNFFPIRILMRILRLLIPKYFVNAWREVKQVSWPNRRETRRLTIAVFTFAIIFGAMVAVVDKGLDVFFKQVVLK